MAKCILRREDDLGQEHTIKMHGGHVASGTTDAAEVGAPVGTSRAKTSLNYVEGIEGYRLRQLSLMQSLFVAAKQNMQPAIERQGDSLDRLRQFHPALPGRAGKEQDHHRRTNWPSGPRQQKQDMDY